MYSIMQNSAPQLLSRARGTSSTRAQYLAFYSNLVKKCKIDTTEPLLSPKPQQQMLTICTNKHNIQFTKKQALATPRGHNNFSALGPSSSMLASQYLTRFMSTLQRSILGANSKQTGDEAEGGATQFVDSPAANKRVQITACGQLYSELSKTKPILFSSAPQAGIQFDVEYFDSLALLPGDGADNSAEAPQRPATVCLLHGAPGHYKDFSGLIQHLTSKRIRVVAPNFPDYSATFDHSFRHSPRERLEFLLEFFKTIGVSQVDLLAGHSSAVYTMFELLNYSKKRSQSGQIEIKSLALFSTPSHVLPHNLAVTPFRLFTLKLFDYPVLRPIIMSFIQVFVKLQGIRNRVDKNKIEDLLIAASAVGYSQHTKMANRLRLMREHSIPALLVYGTNDRLITLDNYKQLERDLGITSEHQVKQYKSDGSLKSAPRSEHDLVDVSRFESGGHYTFQKYSSQVGADLHDFLARRVLNAAQNKGAAKHITGLREVTKL